MRTTHIIDFQASLYWEDNELYVGDLRLATLFVSGAADRKRGSIHFDPFDCMDLVDCNTSEVGEAMTVVEQWALALLGAKESQ